MKTIADRIERALDDALDMTFPASDPIAVFVPTGAAQAPIETRAPQAFGRSSARTGAPRRTLQRFDVIGDIVKR